MRLLVVALGATVACGGCVLQGTPDGGLAIDPAVRVVPTAPNYATVVTPAPTYVAPAEPTYIPPPPAYTPPGSDYPPPNTQGLPDWTPNQ